MTGFEKRGNREREKRGKNSSFPPRLPVSPLLRLALLVVVLGGGCETSFEPFQESDLYFSVYGFLDGGDPDTQFVAVTPLRDTLFASPRPIDATVTTENLDTGQTIRWRDSVMTFVNGTLGHVFWTTAPIEPRGRYRLAVRRSDGATSHATVTIPDTLWRLILQDNITRADPTPPIQTITVDAAEELAEVRVTYTLVFPEDGRTERAAFSYLEGIRRTGSRLSVSFDAYGDVLDRFGAQSCPRAERVEVFVAAAGAGWPPFVELDPETRALPTVARNVEDGLGFVGGITSETVLWDAGRILFFNKQQECRTAMH